MMKLMNKNQNIQPLSSRIIRYILVENLIYWLTGTIVWIPWYFAEWAGILAMITFVPFTIIIATLYCLHKVSMVMWKREIWHIIGTFVVTCAIIDLFFWILWRGHKILEWYLPITRVGIGNFIGYMEIIIISLITLIIALKISRLQKDGIGAKLKEIHLLVLGIIFFIINVYCAITYW
ncbi:hypothetical protein MBGDC06_00656 [Thermoplasmatales archaeon SCGC AB-539-C06]|nr:hypothetical protein MBGDC06_00656 [Thermoplasmatales archaeon SCGC AB-539-C06]